MKMWVHSPSCTGLPVQCSPSDLHDQPPQPCQTVSRLCTRTVDCKCRPSVAQVCDIQHALTGVSGPLLVRASLSSARGSPARHLGREHNACLTESWERRSMSHRGSGHAADFLERAAGAVGQQEAAPAGQVAQARHRQRDREPGQPRWRLRVPTHLLDREDVLRRRDGTRHAA